MGKGLATMLKMGVVAVGLITALGVIGKMADGKGGKELTPYLLTGAIATSLLYAASKSYERGL